MNKASFKLVFEGPAVENGEIDIQELASSFMAMAGIIQAVNDEINGEDARIAVKLKATGKGSVVVDLVIVQSIIEKATTLFDTLAGHKDGISAAKDLAELLFKVGTVGVVISGGFFSLMKWLAGRKPDKVEQKGGETHFHIGDNYFITDRRVTGLVESIPVREQTNKLISALERKGIENISAQMEGEEPIKINKVDIPSFAIPENDGKEEVLSDKEVDRYFQIDSLSFKEGNKWRVTEGGEPFFVVLEDAHYLQMINHGQVTFSSHDVLHCRVNEKQIMTIKGVLKKEYRILEVIDHKRGPTQLRLL